MHKQIVLNSTLINYDFQKSTRNKHIRLSIGRKGLRVSAPVWVTLESVEGAIQAKAEWILQHLANQEFVESEQNSGLDNGATCLFLGTEYQLHLVHREVKRFQVGIDAQALTVTVPVDLSKEAENLGLAKTLKAWYIYQARELILVRTNRWAKELQLEYNQITIKDLKTRWGSCSQLRNLNFNFRLIQAPPATIDYVIVHELCHLRELNHSAKFWCLVEDYCPDYKQHKAWLKEHGALLFKI